MVDLNEGAKSEITPELIEDTLLELNDSCVLIHLRSLINGKNNFFDTTKGYIQENDESSTGTILDMYLAAIDEDLEIAVRNLSEPKLKEAIKKALASGSVERKILLAYWGLDEASPWFQAEQNITSYQTYENTDFPNVGEIDRVTSKLMTV